MQALKLSTVYQAGVVAWVGFWAAYGQGFGAENIRDSVIFQSRIYQAVSTTTV
jgi:hypothetical protein